MTKPTGLVRAPRDEAAGVLCGNLDTLDLRQKGKGRRDDQRYLHVPTTEPNEIVGAIHPKAMLAILTTREEIDLWMTAPAEVALKLQRPLADDALIIVARGRKKDEGASRPDDHAYAEYRSR